MAPQPHRLILLRGHFNHLALSRLMAKHVSSALRPLGVARSGWI
jgi:hypothetical protein